MLKVTRNSFQRNEAENDKQWEEKVTTTGLSTKQWLEKYIFNKPFFSSLRTKQCVGKCQKNIHTHDFTYILLKTNCEVKQ